MAELIQALNPLAFPQSRTHQRGKEKTATDFSRWMSRAKTANSDEAQVTDFPIPLMSSEGILILAQAQEEEFYLAGQNVQYSYEQAAEISHDDDQYEFDFIHVGDHAGDIMDEEI